MGRMYSVTFDGVGVTASQDLFELIPADDKPIDIVAIMIGQSSDVGDAAAENLRVSILRGHTSGGSGGSSFTPTPLNPADAAAGAAAEINNTTIASGGTAIALYSVAFSAQSGLVEWFPPEARIRVSQANTTVVVRLMAAPTDSLTTSGTLIFEEL